MGTKIPMVVGDVAGPYLRSGDPPLMVTGAQGATKVRMRGRFPLLFPAPAIVLGGDGGLRSITGATLLAVAVRVQGMQVIGVGSVTTLNDGYAGGVVIGPGAQGIRVR